MPRSRKLSREIWPLWKEYLDKLKAENPEAYRQFVKDRLRNWRAKHRDHYNAKQREYQCAYRARKKLKASVSRQVR